MSPINYLLIARAVSPTSAVPAPTSSPSSFDNGHQPNIPIWVGYIAGSILLCAILAILYCAHKASRVWRAKVPGPVRLGSFLPTRTETNSFLDAAKLGRANQNSSTQDQERRELHRYPR